MDVEIDGAVAVAGEPVIIMQRIFDAPREVVWSALTDPKHVAQWYGGHGFENPVCEMDVRPGGRWRHVMRTPDGVDHNLEFVFVEVVKPQKFVWRTAGHAGRMTRGPHDNIMTVTLEPVGRTTRWTLVTRFASFEDREEALCICFTAVLVEGTEKFNSLAKELAET